MTKASRGDRSEESAKRIAKKKLDATTYREFREKANLAGKRWSESHPDRARASHVKKVYGLEWEDYVGLYETQHGGCAICKAPIALHKTPDARAAHVDHCHETEQVRGLLCHWCNKGLGHFKDNTTLLRLAAEYLDKHGETPSYE